MYLCTYTYFIFADANLKKLVFATGPETRLRVHKKRSFTTNYITNQTLSSKIKINK